jgi:hypothetical protein
VQHATTGSLPASDSAGDSEAVTRQAQNQQHQQQQQQAFNETPQGPSPWQQAPRVLSLEGLNPLVLAGQWLPDVKLAAGAADASGQMPGEAPRRITWEEVSVYLVLLLAR